MPYREKYSPIAAFWHTEIGPLNQIIHVWGYDSLEERERIRAEAGKDPHWPPKITPGNIVNMNSEVWTPAPFMGPMGGDQALGDIYEMRIYTYANGAMPELPRRWAVPRGVLAAGRRYVHQVRKPEPLDARVALQGPEPPRRSAGRSQQDSAMALGSPGAGESGKQDNDSGQLFADALIAPGCHCERSVAISSL